MVSRTLWLHEPIYLSVKILEEILENWFFLKHGVGGKIGRINSKEDYKRIDTSSLTTSWSVAIA